MFPWAASAGGDQSSSPSNSLRHQPPPPLSGNSNLSYQSQYHQYPQTQESLESLFSSLAVSDRRDLTGFHDNQAEGGGFPLGGGGGNHSSVGGWIPNYDDQWCPPLFNQGFRANNAVADGGGVFMLPESRDYALRLIAMGAKAQAEPGFWDGSWNSSPYPRQGLSFSSHHLDSPARSFNPRRSSNSHGKQPNRHHHPPPPTSHSSNNNRRADLLHETSSSLENFRGQILSLAQDQYGCRFLQRILGTKRPQEIEYAFLELIDHVGQLMLDQFGNYVVQKLIEVCTDEQMTQILIKLTKNEFQLINICLNVCGTRVIQKLLDHVTTTEQVSIIMPALSRGAVSLTKDMNGHHMIQHCLKSFSHEDNKYLLNEVADNCLEIATDKSGCCVLQVCVEYSRGETRDRLVSEIIGNALHLSQNCYGNYVVQNIVGLKVEKINTTLLAQLQGDLVNLACNKYGSNVVEKCLTETTEEQSNQVMMELLTSPKSSLMLVDPFGNFVIQTALDVSQSRHNGMVQSMLIELVRNNVQLMQSNIYGKKVLAWFGKRQWLH